jgi:hypothetical protein
MLNFKEWKLEVEGYSLVDAVEEFIFGAFRNIAIQYHFGGHSKTVEETLHQDHVFLDIAAFYWTD